MRSLQSCATLLALALGLCLLDGSAQAGVNPQMQTALWAQQKLRFDYTGFTTHYSCDGLVARIHQVLGKLQARNGFRVMPAGCDDGRPVPLPSVDIELAALRPSNAPGAIRAVWKPVSLGGTQGLQGADCELAEEIVQKILPLFQVRNVRMNTTCTPHQMPTGPVSLTLEVLAPAPPLRP